jgi:thioredoxin 1
MTSITAESFDLEVAEGVALVDFTAVWCAPCKALEPILLELEADFPGIKFFKVNVDEEPELSGRFRIRSIPCLLVLENGVVVHEFIGLSPKDDFEVVLREWA